jgi:hypothetical protein
VSRGSIVSFVCVVAALSGCGTTGGAPSTPTGSSPASASRALGVVLDRTAAAAVAVTQPSFGPGKFWYTRTLERGYGPGSRSFRSTVETWFGFDGTSRTRSASPARSVWGQDSVTVGYRDYGPGDGVGLSQALFTGAQLASLPTDSGLLRAAIDAGEKALSRQDNALKIQVQRTTGSSTSQIVVRSKLTTLAQGAVSLLLSAMVSF